MQGHSPLVQVVFYIAIGGLIGKRTGALCLKDVSLSEQFFVYLCAFDWYSPEKFKSISGDLSPWKPKKVSNGMS